MPNLISATNLDAWADTRDAQDQLPRLVRLLILHSQARITQIRMPSDESVQLPGWDGVVENLSATAFIPEGLSCWEFGTSTNVRVKATGDYNKRTAYPGTDAPNSATFVFVTPRNWPGKEEWVNAHNEEGQWKAVRALDATDLVAWLEVCPSVHIWASQMLGRPWQGVNSLESFWQEWTTATEPAISPELMIGGRQSVKEEVLAWLQSDTSSSLTLHAETMDEAIGFLGACSEMMDGVDGERVRARAVIMNSQDGLDTIVNIAGSLGSLVLISRFDNPERLAIAVSSGHKVFIAQNHGGGSSFGGATALPRLSRDAAEKALVAQGLSYDRARDLATLARRSFSAFRRKIAVIKGIQTPDWARSQEGRSLLGPLLVGAWDGTSLGDCDALSRIAGTLYDSAFETVLRWANAPDPPFRRIGNMWMVAAREDAWRLLARYLTTDDLERFKRVCIEVLTDRTERDPSLDLPEESRWMARFISKVPLYSHWLRTSLAETLAMMAAFSGDVTFSSDLSGQEVSDAVVGSLLNNSQEPIQAWMRVANDLPLLAEATPDVFLRAAEKGVRGDVPFFGALFQDSGSKSSFFGPSSTHTEILWALEVLVWNERYLVRSTSILATLARIDPGGPTLNRPMNSLRDVFFGWAPQTSAPLVRRLVALENIRRREPDVAWALLLRLMPSGSESICLNTGPRWRDWLPDPRLGATDAEYINFTNQVTTWLLEAVGNNSVRWSALIDASGRATPHQRDMILTALENLGPERFTVEEQQAIQDQLREVHGQHAGYPDAQWAMPQIDIDRLKTLRDAFTPDEPVRRYAWLFRSYVPLPEVERRNWEVRDAVLHSARRSAIEHILSIDGLSGVLLLAEMAENARIVGTILASTILIDDDINCLLRQNLDTQQTWRNQFAFGIVETLALRHGQPWIERRAREVVDLSEEQVGDMLLAASSVTDVASVLDQSSEVIQRRYWSQIVYPVVPQEAVGAERVIERMVRYGRPQFLLGSLHWLQASDTPIILPHRLADLLETCIHTLDPNFGNIHLFVHESIELLDYLDGKIEDERLALLEWLYMPLHEGQRNPQYLGKALATDPKFFVGTLTIIYRRDDEATEVVDADQQAISSVVEELAASEQVLEVEEIQRASSFSDLSQEQQARRQKQIWSLFHHWRTMPGSRDDGSIDAVALKKWVADARDIASTTGVSQAADVYIGHILAYSPTEEDGTWPVEAVRDVIDETASETLERGFHSQIYNRRGVTMRNPVDGGEQERHLATKYHNYANTFADLWPRTAAVLYAVAQGYEREAKDEDLKADMTQDNWR